MEQIKGGRVWSRAKVRGMEQRKEEGYGVEERRKGINQMKGGWLWSGGKEEEYGVEQSRKGMEQWKGMEQRKGGRV